jgi:SAM-dependent methyltransferase
MLECPFCENKTAHERQREARHPRFPDHGPFDLYTCAKCESTFTYPTPTDEQLAAFYRRYPDGLPSELIAARSASPQTALYSMFADRIASTLAGKQPTTWYDVAAGTAMFSQIFAARYPESAGTGIDFHARPANLSADNVSWLQCDINAGGLRDLPPADVVVALAILEHVPRPDAFLGDLVRLVAPGGVLYFMCPDSGSLMARVTGNWWPYYSPGEHLNVPTVGGARALLGRVLLQNRREATEIMVQAISIPYTIQYLAAYLRLPLRGLIPATVAVPVPAGILECNLRLA